MLATDFKICTGSWAELKQDAQSIREQVFIQEQKIAAEDEWDAEDATALHFIIYDQYQAIATARLLNDYSVGRVAVLKVSRGLGIGKLLMQAVIEYAKQHQYEFLKLSAQVHAIAFYTQLGFKREGAEYLDCGIPHIEMRHVFT